MFRRITAKGSLVFLVLAWLGIIFYNHLDLNEKIAKVSNRFLLAYSSFIGQDAPDKDVTPLFAADIIDLTNKYREAGGLVTLRSNDLLTMAAEAKVDDMFKNNYFSHISKTGKGPSEFAEAVNYQYILVGENLAMGIFDDSADLVTSWMNSPGHRENIMHQGYSEIGVAAKQGMYEGKLIWMIAQEFGTPLSACGNFNDSREIIIKTYKKQLNDLKLYIDAKDQELQRLPKNTPEYSTTVSAYNKLVKEYNDLAGRTRKLLDAYNNEANSYNNCMETFKK